MQLPAVPDFTVVTSAETTRYCFGEGLPAAYDYHVPPITSLVDDYLAAGQTLEFIDVGVLDVATRQRSAASMLEKHKALVLVESAGVSDAAGAALLAFARSGGSVIVRGSALARNSDGVSVPLGFATPLGQALGLRRAAAGPPAGAAVFTSRNISKTANPEWWRLVATPGSSSTQLDGAVGPGLTIHVVDRVTNNGESDECIVPWHSIRAGSTS